MIQVSKSLARSARADFKEPAERAARAFEKVASRRGLIDVAYAVIDSPVGELLVATTEKGLVRLAYGTDLESLISDLAHDISPRVLEAPPKTDPVRRSLDEYFDGKRKQFELPIDWRLSKGFYRKVLQATARIPFGAVSTYRDMASKAGNARATRAAGNAVGSNPIAIVVPCHRVLRTGGGLGGYGGGLDKKVFLLELEGVAV